MGSTRPRQARSNVTPRNPAAFPYDALLNEAEALPDSQPSLKNTPLTGL
jgi:hypothetical protein